MCGHEDVAKLQTRLHAEASEAVINFLILRNPNETHANVAAGAHTFAQPWRSQGAAFILWSRNLKTVHLTLGVDAIL